MVIGYELHTDFSHCTTNWMRYQRVVCGGGEVCKNKVGTAQRAGGVSPPLENQHASQPNGGLTPPARLCCSLML